MAIRTKAELKQYITNTFLPDAKVPAVLSNTKINASQHKTFLDDLVDSIEIGVGIDDISISGNIITVTKTDGTTESVTLPSSVASVSQNSSTGAVTFTFNGTTNPVTIQTISDDEEAILSTITGFEDSNNNGKILSIDSNGDLVLIDDPTGSIARVTSVSQDTTAGTATYTFADSTSVTIQTISDSEENILSTIIGFLSSSNDGKYLAIDSAGNLVLVDAGTVDAIREVSLSNNVITITKTDSSTETINLPNSVSAVSENASAGSLTFSFNGNAADVTVQTISDDEEAILTTIRGFEDTGNSGKYLAINSAGNLVLVDSTQSGSIEAVRELSLSNNVITVTKIDSSTETLNLPESVSGITQNTTSGEATFSFNGSSSDVTIQTISDSEENILSTINSFLSTSNSGMFLAINSAGNLVLVDNTQTGSVDAVRDLSLLDNVITVTKTDSTTESLTLPSSVSSISQDTSSGSVTFSFNGSASDIIIQTISDNEEALLSTLSGFENSGNDGKIVSIDSNGNFALIDSPVTADDRALLTTLLGFEDSANDGKVVSIDSNGDFVLIDAPSVEVMTTFTSPDIPNFTVDTTITPIQFAVTNPADGETFTYTATNLPSGLSLSTSGLLSGTPTVTGLFNVLVTATGSNGTTLTTRPRIDVRMAPVTAESSVFWQSDDTAPSSIPADAESGIASADQTITIPETTADGYLVIVQPATIGDLTAIVFSGLNQIGAFSKGDSTFTSDSINYEYWISDNELFHNDLQGQTLELRRA